MHRIAKLFLFALGILLFLYCSILLCVNLYLQSAGVQDRLTAGAGNALGVPVAVRGTSYTPWSGLNLSGITVPNAENPSSPLLNAAAVSVRFLLLPLFQGRMVVREIVLDSPTILWQQPAPNEWQLPVPALSPGFTMPSHGLLPSPSAPQMLEPSATGTPAPSIEKPARPATKWIVEIKHFRIRHGTITINDPDGHELLHIEGANLDVNILPDKTADGYLWVTEAVLHQLFYPQNIRSHFTWKDQVLNFPDVRALLDEGSLSGTYAMYFGSPKQFTTDLTISDASLFHIADDIGIGSDSIEGTLNGNIRIAGDPTALDTLNGKAQFTLDKAKFKPMDFIQQIGTLLQIDELQILQLQTAQINLTVEGRKVNIDNATLKSQNVILDGKGPIRLNGGLDIKARLLIDSKLQNQVGRWLGTSFVDSEYPDYKQLPFVIDGKIDRPHTDLMDKLVGEKMNGINLNGLFNFLTKPDRGQQKRKSPHNTSPSPSPTPNPSGI